MDRDYSKIQELLHQRADFQARLNLLPYDGTPEVKDRDGKKYLYIRKRVGSRLTSTYAGDYSDEFYQLLLRNACEGRELKKNIRRLDKDVVGYPTDYSILCHIAALVNEGFYRDGGIVSFIKDKCVRRLQS